MRRAQLLTLVGVVIAAAGVTVCSTTISPDTAKFLCAQDSDCGSGYVCVTQSFSAKGACFKKGACSPEVCDGLDNDCNGVVDDTFDFSSDPNNCGSCGTVCAAGSTCVGACVETACSDGIDNNNDGATDCANFNCLGASCSATDGGVNCGFIVPPNDEDGGLGVAGCRPRETNCADGVDNDGDEQTDCEDSDCTGRACDTDGGTCVFNECQD